MNKYTEEAQGEWVNNTDWEQATEEAFTASTWFNVFAFIGCTAIISSVLYLWVTV